MAVIRRSRGFLERQSHNYRMMLVRSGRHVFFYNLTGNYDSIYTTALGADPVTLVSILVTVPINIVTDQRGRKAAIYLIRPFLYVWWVMLVVAPNPMWLIVAWTFRGVGMAISAWETLGMELVSSGQRGRWVGRTNTPISLFRIPALIIGGVLYRGVNPSLIFVIPLFLDVCIRIPILAFMVPETIGKKAIEESEEPAPSIL